eukprot:3110220-Heterocapsa_arctica.AAC.1
MEVCGELASPGARAETAPVQSRPSARVSEDRLLPRRAVHGPARRPRRARRRADEDACAGGPTGCLA